MNHPPFQARWVSETLGLSPTPAPSPKAAFSRIVTDSRKAQAGDLFVAIEGEKFDGHRFAAAAIAQGASGVLVQKGKAELPASAKAIVFEVEGSTLDAYRALAGAWRKKFPLPVVAVAGSVGKTTTKELLAAILRGKYPKVLSTQGSQNGYLGVAMTLLELREEHGAAVIEVGIDEPGVMEKHIPLIAPTAALLTAIGPEHLEKLIDVPTVAREEGVALTMTAANGGVVVVNENDPWIADIARGILKRDRMWRCRFADADAEGRETASTAYTFDGGRALVVGKRDGDRLSIGLAGGSAFDLKCPLPGEHNLGNLLTATTMAFALGLNPIEIQRGLQSFGGVSGRSELKTLPKDTPVLCDYYNANPSSVEAGLRVLAQTAGGAGAKKATWAVLGDMLELGDGEEKFHRDLSAPILANHVDRVLLYGERMKWLLDELERRGFGHKAAHYATHAELAHALLNGFQLGDALLIKGSRGMRMEEVWKIVEPELLRRPT